MPQPDQEHVLVTMDGYRSLATFLSEVNAWMGAASGCLEVAP